MSKTNKILLIVDDDDDDRNLFIESAKEVNENITCLSASNGQAALKLLKDTSIEKPDFIFLDLRMPGFNGKKTLQEIRKDPELFHIPIFIYTTSRGVKEAQELKELGAVHFISKPVNPDEIYFIIDTVIEEKWDKINKY